MQLDFSEVAKGLLMCALGQGRTAVADCPEVKL